MKVKKSILAFTLSEVLITLGIIGVVAAITIPTLMNKIQDRELKVAWKKNFSILSAATANILNENGGTFVGAFSSNHGDGARWFAEQYKAQLSYITYCNDLSWADQRCWLKDKDGYEISENYLNGSKTFSANLGGYPAMILKDGSYIIFHTTGDPTCGVWWGGLPEGVCGDIYVDVNGDKPPNTLGRDIFAAWITSKGVLKPYGTKGDWWDPATTCVEGSTATTNDGRGCAAKYLYED